jgi:hypothetical protein
VTDATTAGHILAKRASISGHESSPRPPSPDQRGRMTSSLVMRMKPDETACPIYSGWLVPCMRYKVSLLRS